MREFFEIARANFMAAFGGAWLFPLLLASAAWIVWQGKGRHARLLAGIVPLAFLFVYWCPLSGMLFVKILGEDIYWRLLWLAPMAVTIPCAACLLIKKCRGTGRQICFLACLAAIGLCGKKVLSQEWFEASTNVYKVPQYVIEVGELLPGNVHVLASNRLMPYLRLYDPTITLEYARNALVFNSWDEVYGPMAHLYKAVQEPEIDVDFVAPLARAEGCTFLVLSSSRTYKGSWEDYGYQEYAQTGDFTIFADQNYEEGQDTSKWED